jgi:hypothetical protein
MAAVASRLLHFVPASARAGRHLSVVELRNATPVLRALARLEAAQHLGKVQIPGGEMGKHVL